MSISSLKRSVLAAVTAVSISPSVARAYPSFTGYGYSSCLTCHYNAFGNGPLNDYGRMIGATVISGRVFSPSADDEEVAANSGFLWDAELPDWLRPSVGLRALNYTRSLGNKPVGRTIPMQGEGSLVVKWGPRDAYYTVLTYGFAPKPRESRGDEPATKGAAVSREHYFSFQIEKEWRVFVGMMDKVYGIRVPDHIAFSRDKTLNAQNDQTHGATVHYAGKTWEGGLGVFAGNLLQDPELRQKGASGMLEFEPEEKIRFGASALTSRNDYVQYTMGALHSRIGTGKGSSIMVEIGAVNRTPKVKSEALAAYGFIQSLLALGGGFHFLNTIEYYTDNTKEIETRQLRFTPGFQYFPAQRIELRVEVMNSRNFNPDGVQDDTWDLLSQLHLWF